MYMYTVARRLSFMHAGRRVGTRSGWVAHMHMYTADNACMQVDVWALAVMLWEVMMDTKPWEGRYTDFNKLKFAILHGEKLQLPLSCQPFPPCYVNAHKLGMQTRVSHV